VTKAGSQVNLKQARKRAQNLTTLETKIGEVEALISECERQLQVESEAQRYDEVRRLADEHSAARTQLESLMESWVALAGE
jgi:ABC transporter C-terminal domain